MANSNNVNIELIKKSYNQEKIIDMAPTKVIETNDTYDFTFIVKKYESIGTFKNY